MSGDTINEARSLVGLASGLTSQANGPRLPFVSTIEDPPGLDQGRARTLNWTPCACGGVIVVREYQTSEMAVVVHQDEVRHLKWYVAQLERELADRIEPVALWREGRIYE